MKSVAMDKAASDLNAVLNSAQKERVVLTRHGKPSAIVVGVEAYDAEDLRLMGSAEFWQMIESRRRSGDSISLGALKRRLSASAKQRRASPSPAGRTVGHSKTRRPRS